MSPVYIFLGFLTLSLTGAEVPQAHRVVKGHMTGSLRKLPWKWRHEKTSYKVKTPLTVGVDVVSSFKVSADSVGLGGIFKTSDFHQPDCSGIIKRHPNLKGRNGVYTIYPDGKTKKRVFCDMTTDGGGWTVIQRRKYGSTRFFRKWRDYKKGFGRASVDYWLGNDAIHSLTSRKAQELRIDLQQFSGAKAYAKYSTFSIADEKGKYRLKVGGYSGTAGDSLQYHNNHIFATKDKDNGHRCAKQFQSAWWYNACYYSNLNGPFRSSAVHTYKAIVWRKWKEKTALKSAKMMIRPRK
ncbi:ryncolin-1-like [Ostrea edulis]|uniref:ryncolin-1-like n=1 Tax=Ostrea edulis TaxID=37623 RepID=UPI0024AFC4A3|nr:ryncolin-1-like [Ostrea edulis]